MFINPPGPSEESERIYRSIADVQGFVMNLSKAWAWRPDIFDGFADLRNQLTSQSTFSKLELAAMVCSAAAELGDSYCALAWGKTLAVESSPELAASVIDGSSVDGLTTRAGALAKWARKVARDPNSTTRQEVDALRSAGFNDREIFEATAFIAFRLAFSTVNDALGINPDGELFEGTPAIVRNSVTFGRSAKGA